MIFRCFSDNLPRRDGVSHHHIGIGTGNNDVDLPSRVGRLGGCQSSLTPWNIPMYEVRSTLFAIGSADHTCSSE